MPPHNTQSLSSRSSSDRRNESDSAKKRKSRCATALAAAAAPFRSVIALITAHMHIKSTFKMKQKITLLKRLGSHITHCYAANEPSTGLAEEALASAKES